MTANESPPPRVLIVEDDPGIRTLLQQVLRAEGCVVTVAADGEEGLARAAEWRPDLVLLDIEMPGLSGIDVCRRLKADPVTRLTPVLMMTGQYETYSRIGAWETGADEYLTKPFHLVEVRARCRSLLRLKHLIDELDTAQSVIFAWARALEAKSPYTRGHADRVAALAVRLADALGRPTDEREIIRRGSLLHDIGKIGIPDAILDKAGKLTPEEFEIVKSHPAAGARIVEPLKSVRALVPIIRWHHERIDGRGYPDGLRGDVIPLAVRIVSVADVYDSLASVRPYRDALTLDRSLKIMREDALNGGLDPELVAVFADLITRAPIPTPGRHIPALLPTER
jgi:putative two-component system response regulator